MKKTAMCFLVCVLLFCLAACGSEPAETTVPTAVTADPASQATEPPIDNAEALRSALESNLYVLLDSDITLDATAVVRGGQLDGCGYTLTGPVYEEGNVASENCVSVSCGVVRNVTLLGDYRAIGNSRDLPISGDVRLMDVTVQGDTYALNFGYGNGTAMLWAENSNFYGWCSYTGFGSAQFTGCTFGWGDSKGTANLRPYVDTMLTECRFEGKTDEEGNVIPYNLTLNSKTSGLVITMENCYVGDTLITKENIHELMNVELYDNVLRVYNTADE